MRILFYSNWYIKQTLQLANALASEHRVTLIFPEYSPELNACDGRVAGLRAILVPGVTLITLPHMQKLDPLGWIPVLKTRRIIRETRPDVVHFNESYDFRCWLLMRLCPGVPYVTTVHDPRPHSGEEISLGRFKHWVRDQIRLCSSGLVVHGHSLRDVLSEYSGIPLQRIYSVPHGEYRYYTYFDKHAESRAQDGCKRILFFGRWEDYKGLDVLIDAEPIIARRVADFRIILAGEGRLSLDDLRPRMVHAGNFEVLNYAIPDSEVAALFRSADVIVLPYRQASQSGPLHIAATFAKPAVVTRVGALPEVVKHGETGLLIPPGDPVELAQAVCWLLENPERARQLGENARAHLAQNQSMEEVARIQSEVYRRVLEIERRASSGLILSLLQVLVKKLKRDPNYSLDESLRITDVFSMLVKLATSGLRGLLYRPFLGRVRGICFINSRVKLRNCRHIRLGRNFVAESGCEIQGLSRFGVVFGDDVTVGSFALIRPSGYYGREIGEGVKIGDRSNIGPYCYLGATGGIEVGRDVLMGPRVSLFAENHNFDRTDIPIRQQGCTRHRIVVEDDCWLGSGSLVLAGVTIGRGSVVAAGSVVTKDVPPYSVVAGSPAKIVRSRLKSPRTAEVPA